MSRVRMLEAATVNPHDGEAQYQLGLIHQHRRQRTEALQRFRNAVQIDPTLIASRGTLSAEVITRYALAALSGEACPCASAYSTSRDCGSLPRLPLRPDHF